MSNIITLHTPSGKELSQRKLETYARYCKVLDWGRKHPVEFCSRFMGIELLDYQAMAIVESWTKEFIGWIESRNAGKTTKAGIYVMLRSLLIPYHATYLIGNVGDQSKEIFSKIEKIAKREIESFTGSTEFFLEEVRINIAGSDGFSHLPTSYKCELFNGSGIYTLNGDPTNIKGKRANLVVFDEVGWMQKEVLVQAEQFVNQSSDFKMGGNIRLAEEPKNFPRQLLYCSSASDTESEFYKKMRGFTIEMLSGNPRYYVCMLDADAVKTATKDGDPYPSLLSQEKIDNAMRENPDKAMRELYNKFDSESHEGQILTRRQVMQHTRQVPPELKNPGTKRYVLSWDSARINDGSIVEAAELINDPEIGWRMELKNVIALVDPNTKNKTPMRIPEQVDAFHQILLNYNGSEFGKLDYENIEQILVDSGAAGQPYAICDELVPDFDGDDGRKHKGVIDASHKLNRAHKGDFPDAVDIVTMVDPRAHRTELYRAIEDMMKLGVVTLPADYDRSKPYFTYYDKVKTNKKDEETGETIYEEIEKRHELTMDEQIALMQVELLKTELVTMCKYVNQDNVRYDYPPDKRNIMHDDRIYAFGLLCWHLAQLRRGQTLTPVKRDKPLGDLPVCVTQVNF